MELPEASHHKIPVLERKMVFFVPLRKKTLSKLFRFVYNKTKAAK